MILLIFFNHLICSSSQQKEVGFIYNGIGQAQADLHLQWLWPRRSKWVMLSSSSHSILIHMWKNISFWTHFVVSASIDFTQADPTQYLGLFKISTNGSPSSQLLAIELHNVQSAEFDDIDKNHIGIDINSLKSIESASASYFSNTKGKNQSTRLLSGQPLQVWVDYERALLNVTVAPLRIQKPNHPLLSRSINLTDIFPNQKLYFGFSAATGSLVRYQYISGWSFSRSRVLLQRLDYSKLPQIPHTITYGDGK